MMTMEETRAEFWLLTKGILQDSVIDADEARVVKRWLEEHQRESEYATVIAQLDAFMSDGYIDPRESRNIADAIGRLLSGMHK
jgi:uncharacterized membrane protein YebE (DUF533 family)